MSFTHSLWASRRRRKVSRSTAAVYANRFDTDDTGHRLLVAGQLLAVAALAAGVHDVVAHPATFGLAYVAVRVLLIVEYLRAGRHVPAARALIRRYITGFSLALVVWLAALALPAPLRYAVWAVAMVIDLGTPLTARHIQRELPPQPSHLPERFGLFVVIVLGESVFAVVTGISERAASGLVLVSAGLGVAVAVSLWWLYFDNIEERVVLRTNVAGQVWVFGHLPLLAAIAAAGAGMARVIAHDHPSTADVWLLAGAVAAALVMLAVLHTAAGHARQAIPRLLGAAAVLALAAGTAGLTPPVIMAAVALPCAAQAAYQLIRT